MTNEDDEVEAAEGEMAQAEALLRGFILGRKRAGDVPEIVGMKLAVEILRVYLEDHDLGPVKAAGMVIERYRTWLKEDRA